LFQSNVEEQEGGMGIGRTIIAQQLVAAAALGREYACNPSTWKAEDHKFEASLGYIPRPFLNKIK
jgi:hypothetical protein